MFLFPQEHLKLNYLFRNVIRAQTQTHKKSTKSEIIVSFLLFFVFVFVFGCKQCLIFHSVVESLRTNIKTTETEEKKNILSNKTIVFAVKGRNSERMKLNKNKYINTINVDENKRNAPALFTLNKRTLNQNL